MNVKKILLFSLCLTVVFISAYGQEPATSQKKYARPNIPGTFVVELGVNRAQNRPDKYMLYAWGSRALNIYYQYDMRILKSKFSFHPGIGFGMERYKFRNGYILAYDNNGVLSMQTPSQYKTGISGLTKSQFVTNYLDIPMELRFSTNPDDPTRSFKISVGGRFGYLLSAYTKVKYREDGDKIKIKEKRDFNLNNYRYGIYAKIGGGNFSMFGYYNLSTLFKTGQGPIFGNSEPTEMNNFTVGISLSSF
jgi:hypothetical protein